MKIKITPPSHGRQKFTEEYKQQALALWRKSGRSANLVAVELGIRPVLLYRWARAERGATGPKPGAGLAKAEELQAEIARLREENAKLLEQREVLKKSLGILSETPGSGLPRSRP
mgnify:CR=1 FL=1